MIPFNFKFKQWNVDNTRSFAETWAFSSLKTYTEIQVYQLLLTGL
jgi:hypothetical protein